MNITAKDIRIRSFKDSMELKFWKIYPFSETSFINKVKNII